MIRVICREAGVSDIKKCLQEKKCFPKYISLMVCVLIEDHGQKEWLQPNSDSFYMRKINDLESNTVQLAQNISLMSSYMMRRHNSYDIPYDENFLMRGYDDVELIQHLYHESIEEEYV